MSELVRRIAFTIGALLIFRLGTQIPVVPMLMQTGAPLPAGVFPRVSIFSLALLPYFSAAVIIRLVCMVCGRLNALEQSGEAGRRAIARATLILTLVLATFQAYGVASGLQAVSSLVDRSDRLFLLSATTSIVGGVFVLIWLAEQITRHGIGNGLALVWSVSILAPLPREIAVVRKVVDQGMVSGDLVLLHIVFWVIVVVLMVLAEGARRNVRVDFPGCKVGTRMLPVRSAVLPIKLNSAGVLIPIMVAPWFWSLPLALAARNFGGHAPWLVAAHNAIAFGKPAHLIIGSIVVFVLALVYTSYLVDPERAADSLAKRGGAIPGVEPGEPTATYLDRVMSSIAVVGAVYLVAVSLIPEAFAGHGNLLLPYEISGGSVLIVVCTILDIQKQVREVSLTNPGGEHR